jgi:phage baseplate assembly protein gpV
MKCQYKPFNIGALLLSASFFVLLTVSCGVNAMAQMSYGSTYSNVTIGGDSDSYDASSPTQGYVDGQGATEDSYNSYGHQYWVVTTISNQYGSSSTVTSSSSTYFTEATATLPLGAGNFTVDTEHWYYCPIANQTLLNSTSGAFAEYLGSEDVYYKLSEQVGPAPFSGIVDCYYDVCYNSTPNICNKTHFLIRKANQNCAQWIKITWFKYKVLYVFERCSRLLPVELSFPAC